MGGKRLHWTWTTVLAVGSFVGGFLTTSVRATIVAKAYAEGQVKTIARQVVQEAMGPLNDWKTAHQAEVDRDRPVMYRAAHRLEGAIKALCLADPRATKGCLEALSSNPAEPTDGRSQ